MVRPRRFVTPMVVAALAPVWIGCSSATDPTASKALTSHEAQTVASALFAQIFGALGTTAGFAQRVPASGALLFSRVAATTNTFSGACPLGGSVSGTYTENGTLDANGTGTIAMTSTYAPSGCVVSTGSRNVTVNGAPALTMSVSVPLVRYAQSGIATFQMGGGFSYDAGTCQINYTVSFSAAGHGTITGSVCGQDVSQSI